MSCAIEHELRPLPNGREAAENEGSWIGNAESLKSAQRGQLLVREKRKKSDLCLCEGSKMALKTEATRLEGC